MLVFCSSFSPFLFHSLPFFYVLIYMLCFTSPAPPVISHCNSLPLLIKLHMCMYSLFRLHCIIHLDIPFVSTVPLTACILLFIWYNAYLVCACITIVFES
ncbi:hypothetical protein M413DRAFT_354005 [Hebeloma cylindrosporum]|uniref:Uncharacterized protein n=1 Tax=Hebeloma cylindrosporum TaxID=76867 RepID=A0A0C3CL08_HEBCY|nr:hypothetical protein M413DRAFT_354005 [Hebeloma cylindrosporum h7]